MAVTSATALLLCLVLTRARRWHSHKADSGTPSEAFAAWIYGDPARAIVFAARAWLQGWRAPRIYLPAARKGHEYCHTRYGSGRRAMTSLGAARVAPEGGGALTVESPGKMRNRVVAERA